MISMATSTVFTPPDLTTELHSGRQHGHHVVQVGDPERRTRADAHGRVVGEQLAQELGSDSIFCRKYGMDEIA